MQLTTMLLALLQDSIGLPWDKLIYGAQGIMVLGIILVFFLRIAPTWKEVKLEEFKARNKDSDARISQSKALESVSEVLYEVAVEQRRAADSVKVLQRINSRSVDDLEVAVTEEFEAHARRIAALEQLKQHVANTTSAHSPAAN